MTNEYSNQIINDAIKYNPRYLPIEKISNQIFRTPFAPGERKRIRPLLEQALSS
jgi:hypothetical protein